MSALLGQVLFEQTPVQQFLPWIAIATLAYFFYMVFGKKDSKYIEMLTTQRVLIPLFMLVAFSLVPSSVMALFGIAETLVTSLIQIFVSILLPLVVVAGCAYLAKYFGLI